MSELEHIIVRIASAENVSVAAQPTAATAAAAETTPTVTLSPFDDTSAGRAIPMVWFFDDTLPPEKLCDALANTLVAYPVLAGRYAPRPAGRPWPTAIVLSNAGVPVHTAVWDGDATTTAAAACAYILQPEQPPAAEAAASAAATPSVFPLAAHVPFVPDKADIDPDKGSATAPLLKVKITTFPDGGTAIGILVQHCVMDAEAAIGFMRNWSRVYRGESMSPVCHDRCIVAGMGTSSLSSPSGSKFAVVSSEASSVGEAGEIKTEGEEAEVAAAAAEKELLSSFEAPFGMRALAHNDTGMPPFMPVMPKIMGTLACAVALPSAVLSRLKAGDSLRVPEGQFVSTDDVVTARVWQAMARHRCTQLGLNPETCEDQTTLARAWNFRNRVDPPLDDGYCCNGAVGIYTRMPVRELCAAPPFEVALRLRAALQAATPATARVGRLARWLQRHHANGCRVKAVFDAQALTFIVSSWRFPWERVNFGTPPRCFDHGAHVPIVAVLAPRRFGDGLTVYHSGQGIEAFAADLAAKCMV